MGFVGAAISADSGTAAASVTVTYSPTNGNAVRGFVTFADGGGSFVVNSVKDSNGVSGTLIDLVDDVTNGQALQTFYFKSISGSPTSFTGNISGSTGGLRIGVQEWSGEDPSAPLDKHVMAKATSNSPSSGNVTTTANGEDIYGCVCVTTILSETISQGGGYTIRNQGQNAAASISCADESQTQSSAGSIAATFTLGGSDGWICGIATFKQPASAGSPIIYPANIHPKAFRGGSGMGLSPWRGGVAIPVPPAPSAGAFPTVPAGIIMIGA